MGGSSTAPSGVAPPTVGVLPPSGGTVSSQASAASNSSAAPNSSAGNPAAQAQGSNSEFYTTMYAQFIAALSNPQQSSNAAASRLTEYNL